VAVGAVALIAVGTSAEARPWDYRYGWHDNGWHNGWHSDWRYRTHYWAPRYYRHGPAYVYGGPRYRYWVR